MKVKVSRRWMEKCGYGAYADLEFDVVGKKRTVIGTFFSIELPFGYVWVVADYRCDIITKD